MYVAGRTLELVESAHKSSNKHNSDKEDDSPGARLLPCVCYCLLVYFFIAQQIFEQQISFMQSLSYGAVVKAVRSINCH